jgi:hypothetical protein
MQQSLFSCFLAQNGFGQIDKPIDVQFVLQSIDSINNTTLSEFDKLTAKDSLFDLLRFHYDYLSYKTKFELAKNTQNKEDRIMHIKRVTRYPYYLVSSPFYYGYRFFNLYIDATRALIYEYRGNLEELNKITIVPGAFEHVALPLKLEIEAAGGKWTRGEIYLDPEIKKRGNRFKKD